MSEKKRKLQGENSSNSKDCMKHSFCNIQRFELEDTPILMQDLNKPKRQSLQQQYAIQKQPSQDVSRIIRTDDGLPDFNIEGITEEELDDWIAQSANRPISSYLDPYKKFSAPASLLSELKRRYRQKVKKNDSESKKLYFQEMNSKSNYSQKRQYNDGDLIFDYNNLTPKKISGTSISVRENKSTIQNLTSIDNPYGNPSPQLPSYDNLQNYNTKINTYLNHTNLEKNDSRFRSKQRQLSSNNNNNNNVSQGRYYEEQIPQKPMIGNYGNQQSPSYDPERDINFDKYNKKQASVIKDLQYRYMRNGSVNSALRPQNRQYIGNRNTQFYSTNNNNNNNATFITTGQQRGESAQAYHRKMNYNNSPKKQSMSNSRHPSMSRQQLNRTADMYSISKYHNGRDNRSITGEYHEGQQASELKETLHDTRKTFNDERKISHEDRNLSNNEDLKTFNSPVQPYSLDTRANSKPGVNPFSLGKEQFKNSYQQISGQKNVNSTAFEINLKQINQQPQPNPFNPFSTAITSLQPSNILNNQNKDQQSTKIPSFRLQQKKNVKEEALEKDVVKKIIEKVEKLLSEKEEKLPSEIDQKGGANDRLMEKLPLDKQDEVNSPEQNFNQHLNEITEVVKSKSQQDSAYASFLKGVGRMKKNKDRSAITAFKQALNFDKAHFPTIYNLACVYERNKKFKCAEYWLEIANMFKKNKNDINYGFAIIYYKSQRFEEAYKKIDALIDELAKYLEEEETIPQTHLYLRSLCAKKLGQKILDKDQKIDEKLSKSMINEDKLNISSSSPTKSVGKKSYSGQVSINQKSPEKQKKISDEDKYQEAEDEAKLMKKEQLVIMPSSSQYYKKASEDYKAFIKYTCPKNFMLLKHFMFAVVFKKIRKMEIKFPPHIFCEFFSLVKQILAAETYEPALEPLILNEQSAIQNGWAPPINVRIPIGFEKDRRVNQYPPLIQSGMGLKLSLLERRREEILKKIQDLSFFKRYPVQILQNFLPKFELRYIEKSELLFAQKGEVYIITGGHLTVFDHSKQYNEPDIVAYYSEGDIIGCDDKDNRISFHPDIWFLSLTRVEYIAINESDFIDLWNLQNDPHSKQILTFIRQIDLFERVSQLTLYRLAFELFKEKIFQNKDIVFNDGESVHKYHYIELHKEDPKALKNLRNRIFNKIDILHLTQLAIQGFFIIQEGTLELNTFTNWQHYQMSPYNFVGENLLFPTLSISRFGQIVCASPQAKCLFLSRYDFHKISSLDKEVMKANVLKSDYFANCQRILYKYYKHHKIEDFDQSNISNSNPSNNNNNSHKF